MDGFIYMYKITVMQTNFGFNLEENNLFYHPWLAHTHLN